MNLLLIVTLYIGASGPFSSAIQLSAPPINDQNKENWQTIKVDGTTIELPILKNEAFERTAPDNYKTPIPTKRVAIPCPYHGYSCGMQKAVEDLLGHLQAEHNITLEYANEIGREKWQDLHDNLHWKIETDERKELFLNPQPAKPVQKTQSGCANGQCPTSYVRRFLGR